MRVLPCSDMFACSQGKLAQFYQHNRNVYVYILSTMFNTLCEAKFFQCSLLQIAWHNFYFYF